MPESRIISMARPTASALITQQPCLVYSICGIGIASSHNVYTIHDGQNVDGDIVMRLVAGVYSADFRLFASPLFFAKGLYVEFTLNGAEVFVQYLQVAT